MAEAFVGMTVSVKLKPGAPRQHITGKVVNIHDQMLILEQVHLPETGEYLPSYSCPSYQIADLEVVDSDIYQPQYPSGASTLPLRVTPTVHTDPAILSYDRPTPELPNSATPIMLATPTIPTPLRELPAEVGDGSISGVPSSIGDFVSPQRPEPQREAKKAKGWRSTPLLEETQQPTEETPPQQPKKLAKATKGKKPSKQSQQQAVNANGWATEDATDVQDLGDFDFEANLNKFDKRAVFEQIRIDDTTADEDRLVSHNRARPGTYGGKNLHPTEMVLSPTADAMDGSELDTVSDTDALGAGGRSSRQSVRVRDLRNAPTRQSSGGADANERSMSRALRSIQSSNKPLNSSIHSSARSNSSLRSRQAHFSPSRPHLRTRTTEAPCPTLEPSRLRQVEAEYVRRGLPAETLIELTARAVAQSICTAASPFSPSRRNSKSNTVPNVERDTRGPKPVIVILAGNHATGAKAIAAARHLFGRGFKLLLSLSDYSAPTTWDPVYKTQIGLVKALGRRLNAKLDSWPGCSAQIKRLTAPPALIVDALLDGTTYGAIEDVQMAMEVRDVVDWVNRSRAGVVSLECPSGYDASSGRTTVVEGEPLAVKPDRVLGLGAVVKGVEEALAEGERWEVSVLDIGLAASMRAEEGVRFGCEWSVGVEFAAD